MVRKMKKKIDIENIKLGNVQYEIFNTILNEEIPKNFNCLKLLR